MTIEQIDMKTYTQKQVDSLIRSAISATMQGMLDYFASDSVFVIDKITKTKIENCELSTNGVKRPNDFIYPLLEKEGIQIIVQP